MYKIPQTENFVNSGFKIQDFFAKNEAHGDGLHRALLVLFRLKFR